MISWWNARIPATVALSYLASPGARPAPVVEKSTPMHEPIVREVQLVADNPVDVTLTCRAERTERSIRIHYFLSNQSSLSVLTFDHVKFNAVSTFTLPVDVVCDAGDGSVNLVLGLSPDPVFSRIEHSRWHGWRQDLRWLHPSQNRAGTVEVALPLAELDQWNPFTEWTTVATAAQATEVHTARLIIDFVRPDRDKYDPHFPPGTAESVWCAIPLSPPATLLRHPGFGELADRARWPAFNIGPDRVDDFETQIAGTRELIKARQEHRAHTTRPRGRGTSPQDMPKARLSTR